MTAGKQKSASKEFPATLDHLYEMLQFIYTHAIDLNFDMGDMSKIELVSEEALVNIISYAYPDKKGTIEIFVEGVQEGILIRLSDKGIPYDPVKESKISKEVVENHDPVELRKMGGYGIFFILTLMDKVSYAREGDKNVLTLVKYRSHTP